MSASTYVHHTRPRLWSVALALCLLICVAPRAASAAGGATITTFYSATRASYDAWVGAKTKTPPRASTFPTGTQVVAFYFEYQGATPKSTTFQLLIHDHTGAEFLSGKVHQFSYKAGSEMLTEDNGAAYLDGTYRADVIVDDIRAASIYFTVGAKPSTSGHGVTITRAYMITRQAYDAWDPNSDKDPPAASLFGATSAEIGIFFTYTNARKNVDTFQLLLYTDAGAMIGTGKVHPFHYSSGAEALILPLADGVHLAPASYHAALMIDKVPVLRLPWRVGGAISHLPTPVPVRPTGPPVTVQHCNAADLQAVVRCDEPSVLRLAVRLADGEAQGTGFVIRVDSTGTYLLTNRHVIEGGTADATTAYAPDGKTHYPVLAILANNGKPGTSGDLAVVKLPPTKLRPLAWGNSDQLNPGQTVASIGYGLAFELSGPPSVTEGIVSAVHRDLKDGSGPVWIQHQSTINHGNSGGPLTDLHGDVVGVNTLSIDQLPGESGSGPQPVQGVFFAIPSNTAKAVAQRLIGQLENSNGAEVR